MAKTLIGLLSLAMALGGASASAQSARRDAAPQLQVSELLGTIEVETPSQIERYAGQALPDIRSGSVVRVLSGSAAFESDYRTTVRAGKGDAFHFASDRPEGSRPGALHITAVETKPKALNVTVGDQEFDLRQGAELSIAPSSRNEMIVQVEKGDVRLKPGGMAENRALGFKARTMLAGEKLALRVPEGLGFENAGISRPAVTVTRESETAFLAKGDWRARPAKLAQGSEAHRAISAWPAVSRSAAQVMIEKYGSPNEASSDMLVWDHNGPWKRTVVYRNPEHTGEVLEQTIAYDVPADKVADLDEMNPVLSARRDFKELSSISDSEQKNFLALNLANEVIEEDKTPDEANDFYDKTLSQSKSGRTSPYMQGLMFTHR